MQQDNNIFEWSFVSNFNHDTPSDIVDEVADLTPINEANNDNKGQNVLANNTITMTQIVAFDITNGKARYNPKEQINRVEAFTITPKMQPIKAEFTCYNYTETPNDNQDKKVNESLNEGLLDKAKDKFKQFDSKVSGAMGKAENKIKDTASKIGEKMFEDPNDKNMGKVNPKPQQEPIKQEQQETKKDDTNQGTPPINDAGGSGNDNANPNGSEATNNNSGDNSNGDNQNAQSNNPSNQEQGAIDGIDVLAYINEALGLLKHTPATRNFEGSDNATNESLINMLTEAEDMNDSEKEFDLYKGRSVQDFKNIAKFDDLEVRLQLLHLKVSNNKHITIGEKNTFLTYRFDAKKVERYVNHYELKKLKLIINNVEVPPKTELAFISKLFRILDFKIQLS